jgi:ribonuclease BN (tRNA processing enzyme)
MKVTFFGVRGSYPVPDARMMGYGGRTASVMFSKEINGRVVPIFIDAGIGIIEAGKRILPQIFADKHVKKLNMFFTHLHPDHTEGFTFFAPNFLPQVELNLFGMAALKKNVGMVLRDKMAPPTYPIEYKDLKSTRNHFVISDGQTLYIDMLGQVTKKPVGIVAYIVQAMQAFAPSHPQQGSIYYKVTDPDTNKSVACIWDIESRRGGDQRVISFAKDAEIMIHDTQYTDEEYDSDKMVVQGFGHSTYSMAVENAVKAGVKKALIPFHYSPTHTDDMLDKITSDYKGRKDIYVYPSRENMVIDI